MPLRDRRPWSLPVWQEMVMAVRRLRPSCHRYRVFRQTNLSVARESGLPLHLAKAVRCGPLGLAAEPLGVRSVSG